MSSPVDSSNSSGQEDQLHLKDINEMEVEALYPVIFFYAAILSIGLIGNILVLIVYTFRYKQSPARVYILFLAVIDCGMCSIGQVYHLYDLHHPYTFTNTVACKSLSFIVTALFLISIFGLIVIAVDRYLKICRPLSSLQVSFFGRRRACACAVVMGLALSWPNVILYGPSEMESIIGNETGYSCYIQTSYHETEYPFIYLTTILCTCIVCTVSLVVIYSLICRQVYFHYQRGIGYPKVLAEDTTASDVISLKSFKESIRGSIKGSLQRLYKSRSTSYTDLPPLTGARSPGKIVSKQPVSAGASNQSLQKYFDRVNALDLCTTVDFGRDLNSTCHSSLQSFQDNSVQNSSQTKHSFREQSPTLECKALIDTVEICKALGQYGVKCDRQNGSSLSRLQCDSEKRKSPLESKDEQTGNGIKVVCLKSDISEIKDLQCSTDKASTSLEDADPLLVTSDRQFIGNHKLKLENTLDPHIITKSASVDLGKELQFVRNNVPVYTSCQVLLNPKTTLSRKNTSFSRRRSHSFRTFKQYKITRIMFAVTLVFVISYCPCLFLSIWSSQFPDFWDTLSVQETVVCELFLRFYLVNNVANPFIYGFWDTHFQREIIKLFKKLFKLD